MKNLIVLLVATSLGLFLYSYLLYPAILWLLARWRARSQPAVLSDWPTVSISLPVYNEEAQIAEVVESLLALEYPAERRQILVISDGSTDRTDAIVAGYGARGVELLRMPVRVGKTAAENAGTPLLRGEIVVNTDASVRIHPAALKGLVAQFADASVGVASGRDVSISRAESDANASESGYVGYEMTIRSLETACGGIVGASGCFYAIRHALHAAPLPERLSRDFAAPLIAREHGYRSVSVDDALCMVPRTSSLQREYRRKVRTMTRGIETLTYKRRLLNPFRFGTFAWMLFSHKVCRWLLPWLALASLLSIVVLVPGEKWAAIFTAVAAATLLWAATVWLLEDRVRLPRLIALPAFAVLGNVAALHAASRALRGHGNPIWEPTRRAVTS